MTNIAKPLVLALLALCLGAASCGRYDRSADFTPNVVGMVSGSAAGARVDDPSDSERLATAHLLVVFKELTPIATVAFVLLVLGLAWHSSRNGFGGRGGSKSYWSMKGRRDGDWESPPSY